jgi:hypothetical protein
MAKINFSIEGFIGTGASADAGLDKNAFSCMISLLSVSKERVNGITNCSCCYDSIAESDTLVLAGDETGQVVLPYYVKEEVCLILNAGYLPCDSFHVLLGLL